MVCRIEHDAGRIEEEEVITFTFPDPSGHRRRAPFDCGLELHTQLCPLSGYSGGKRLRVMSSQSSQTKAARVTRLRQESARPRRVEWIRFEAGMETEIFRKGEST